MIRAIVLAAAVVSALSAQTPEDRKFLGKHLRDSLKTFDHAVKGLSEAQWKFKESPDRWSIAECAEHLALTEPFLRGLIVNQVLKAPPPPKPMTREDDQKVIGNVSSRSQKVQAPEPAKPSGKFATLAEAARGLHEERKKTFEWLKTNKEDLRAHYAKNMQQDAYQLFLMISAHTLRHTAQIEEVKRASGYPAN